MLLLLARCVNNANPPAVKYVYFRCNDTLFNFTVQVLVLQESSAEDMSFPRHSFLQALSVLLLALVLVRCQAPLKTEEEDEEERVKEAATATEVTESEPLECPAECSCAAEGAVDCAGVDLTEFPAELHDQTRQLSLQVRHATALCVTANSNAQPHFEPLLNFYLLFVFCLLMPEQQNCRDNGGAHFPSASA